MRPTGLLKVSLRRASGIHVEAGTISRPKVILQLFPVLPAIDRKDRERRRPLGRDADLYHRVLHDWLGVVQAADELGVWGISTIEHHLHSEGYEVGPTPGILNAWWASHVKRANVGALGYVMATQDPIRVAEETAVLDHIMEGRFFVGFARGYQSRWMNILGQFSDAGAATASGRGEEADRRNRDIFEERVEMVLRCWTEDAVEIDGAFYSIPYPYNTGVVGYPGWSSAATAGCAGEVDSTGAIRRVSVVPKPYQQPHPPCFVGVAGSPDSVTYCARNGFRPVHFAQLDKLEEFCRLYVAAAADAGMAFELGERQCIVRWPHFAASSAEYDRQLLEYDLDFWENFNAPFFPHFDKTSDMDWLANMKQSGVFVGGTIDEAVRAWQDIYRRAPCEYICLIWHYAQCPAPVVISELETFMTKVLPELDTPAPEGDRRLAQER